MDTNYKRQGPPQPEGVYPEKYEITWQNTIHPQICVVCHKSMIRGSSQGITPCHHNFHRACLLGVLSHAPNCPQCYHPIPLRKPSIAEPAVSNTPDPLDETTMSEHDRHIYIAQLHSRWSRESREMNFHDTAELHQMAARNHFEWAEKFADEEFKVGVYQRARELRRKAVECERRAERMEREGDGEGGWRVREEGRVAGYLAAKAEDERN